MTYSRTSPQRDQCPKLLTAKNRNSPKSNDSTRDESPIVPIISIPIPNPRSHIPLDLFPGNRFSPALHKRSPRLQHRCRLSLNIFFPFGSSSSSSSRSNSETFFLILRPTFEKRGAFLRTDPFALFSALMFTVEDEDAEGGVDCVAETHCVSTTEMEIGGK